MKNKTKDKFIKIVSSFWFWVAVAIVSHVIFISIPVQWTGNGLEIEEGTGSMRTLFAYLTQFAWIIAFVVLFLNIIKWIHKSKLNDIWKTSFTILGIVGILAYVYFALSGMGLFGSLFYKYDSRIGDTDNEDRIRSHIGFLEEEGYEVLYFGNLGVLDEGDKPYVEMKALGNRKIQVESGLSSLGLIYPDALEYTVRILGESQDCWHTINGTIRRALYEASAEMDFSEALKNLEEYRKSDVYIFGQYIDYQIDNPTCL